jgi:hypothetical protein
MRVFQGHLYQIRFFKYYLTKLISSLLLPVIIMSSTYTRIMVVQSCLCLINIDELVVLLTKLFFNREELSLAYHALGDYFNP